MIIRVASPPPGYSLPGAVGGSTTRGVGGSAQR